MPESLGMTEADALKILKNGITAEEIMKRAEGGTPILKQAGCSR